MPSIFSKNTANETTDNSAKSNANVQSDIFEVKKYIKRYNIDDLIVSHDAQRPLDIEWVNEIVENWNECACTPPVVVLEGKKKLVVDGQHRVKAMQRLGYQKIDCFLIQGVNASEAFLMINNIRPIVDLDKFKQRANIFQFERDMTDMFNRRHVGIEAYDYTYEAYFCDVDFLLEIEEDGIDRKALEDSLKILVDVLEFDGKISKTLLSKVYGLLKGSNNFDTVYNEMQAVKFGLLTKNKNNGTKTKKQMQSLYAKSKLVKEMEKIIEKNK